jgi:hypothetical protein
MDKVGKGEKERETFLFPPHRKWEKRLKMVVQ